MGNTCKPMAVSFQCMTKFTTNKKEKKRKEKTSLKEQWIKTSSLKSASLPAVPKLIKDTVYQSGKLKVT